MMCSCITQVQQQLEPFNTQVGVTLAVRDNTFKFIGVRLDTHKIDNHKRDKPVSMTATYCPFCGQKYESEAPDAPEKS